MLPFQPPIEPMLAKLTEAIPAEGGWLFEPKWDGFRALVFKDGAEVRIQSRDLRPFERYFPELMAPLGASLPAAGVFDGEIVIAGADGLDFEALLLRIHPAASRVAMLAEKTPASFVAFDCLALGAEDLRSRPFVERRARLVDALAAAKRPIHLTPSTADRALAEDWFHRFEGAGLDGVIAKALDSPYSPGKRTMLKIKHSRTADCVVAGFRWYKGGEGQRVGSLLLGLYDAEGHLQHVGVTASFTAARRAELKEELEPLRNNAEEGHPWRQWSGPKDAPPTRRPGATSRWNRGKDLSFELLRPERVAEVRYDHLEGPRFRHATAFLRWRADRSPKDCRYDQLEAVAPEELAALFGAPRR
jgi:ATP-dependent DNA ligase